MALPRWMIWSFYPRAPGDTLCYGSKKGLYAGSEAVGQIFLAVRHRDSTSADLILLVSLGDAGWVIRSGKKQKIQPCVYKPYISNTN